MEERKGVLDYLGQVFVIFGVTLLVIAVTCSVKGEEAKGYSSMFALGKEGIPLETVFEYLLSSASITLLRFLFFSDALLKKTSVTKRLGGMLVCVIGLIGIFAFGFGWFPVEEPKCWVAFLVCFAVCFAASLTVCLVRERGQNKRLAEALKKWKEGQDGDEGKEG